MDGKTKNKILYRSSTWGLKEKLLLVEARWRATRHRIVSRFHNDSCFVLRVHSTGAGRKFIDFNITWSRRTVSKSLDGKHMVFPHHITTRYVQMNACFYSLSRWLFSFSTDDFDIGNSVRVRFKWRRVGFEIWQIR